MENSVIFPLCLYITFKRKVAERSEYKLFITVDEENDISIFNRFQ